MLLFAEAGLELWGEHGQSRPAAPAARSQALQGAFPVPPHLFDLPQPSFFILGCRFAVCGLEIVHEHFFDPQIFSVVASLHLN